MTTDKGGLLQNRASVLIRLGLTALIVETNWLNLSGRASGCASSDADCVCSWTEMCDASKVLPRVCLFA